MHQTLFKPSAYEMKRNQIQGTRVAECNEPQHNSGTSVTLAAINCCVIWTTGSIVSVYEWRIGKDKIMASKDIVFWDVTPYSLVPDEDGDRILGQVHGVK